MLALLRDREGAAWRALDSLGITLEAVRGDIERIVGHGDELRTGQIPFTPRAKKVLDLSLREALSLGHTHIGPEHILLGLVRENSGVAATILYDLGASARAVAAAALTEMGSPPDVAEDLAGKSFADAPSRSAGRERNVEITIGSRRFWQEPGFVTAIAPVLAAAVGLLGLGILIGWLIWG